jgi:hypothetical protein
MTLKNIILKNELVWLKSIGCNINKTKHYISIKRNDNKTTDFNFIIPSMNKQRL